MLLEKECKSAPEQWSCPSSEGGSVKNCGCSNPQLSRLSLSSCLLRDGMRSLVPVVCPIFSLFSWVQSSKHKHAQYLSIICYRPAFPTVIRRQPTAQMDNHNGLTIIHPPIKPSRPQAPHSLPQPRPTAHAVQHEPQRRHSASVLPSQ